MLRDQLSPLFTVPFRQDKFFIGRQQELDKVEAYLKSDHCASLYGLGGTGYMIPSGQGLIRQLMLFKQITDCY